MLNAELLLTRISLRMNMLQLVKTHTPNLSELEAFIDKESDEYLVWRNNNILLSKDTSSASECITLRHFYKY